MLFEAEISGQVRLAHEEGKAQGSLCWTEEPKMGGWWEQFIYGHVFEKRLQTLEKVGAGKHQEPEVR